MTSSPPPNPPAPSAHSSAAPVPQSAPSPFARPKRSPAPCSLRPVLAAPEPSSPVLTTGALEFFQIENPDEPAHGKSRAIRDRRYPRPSPRHSGRVAPGDALRVVVHLRTPGATAA